MKKITLLVFFASIAAFVNGQEIVYQQGKKVNKKMAKPEVVRFFPGPEENQLIVVEPECRGWGENDDGKSIMVRFVDTEWNEFKKTKISNSKSATIHAAYCIDNVLHVVLGSVSSNKREHTFRHVTFNKTTLEILSDSSLVKIQRGFEQNLESWCEVSLDNRYLGIVFTIHSKKNEPIQAEAILFNANMEFQWRKPMQFDQVEKMLVTDDGDIVTGCFAYKDNKEDSLFLCCNVVNSKETLHAKFPADPHWEQLSLLKYYDGMVLASALESNQAKDKRHNRCFTSFHTFLLDMDYARVEVHDAHVFNESDFRLFNNSNATTGSDAFATDHIRVREIIPTSQGAAVLLQRLVYTEIYNTQTGSSSTSVHSYGLMMVHVDSTADIMWTKGIMHNLFYGMDPLKYHSLFFHKGKLFFLDNESCDATETYDPITPVEISEKTKNDISLPVLYSFNAADGNVTKKVLTRKGMHDLFSSVFPLGENKFVFITAKFWAQISTMTFKD